MDFDFADSLENRFLLAGSPEKDLLVDSPEANFGLLEKCSFADSPENHLLFAGLIERNLLFVDDWFQLFEGSQRTYFLDFENYNL